MPITSYDKIQESLDFFCGERFPVGKTIKEQVDWHFKRYYLNRDSLKEYERNQKNMKLVWEEWLRGEIDL
jgi:hypothetical protein